MTRRNGKQPTQHKDTLIPTLPDIYCLGKAVEERFLELCQAYLRIKGVELPIPLSLNRDMLRWRQMRVRHRAGDLRHTEAEFESVKTVAQWTVDENCSLRGQPRKVVDWG